MVPFILTIEYLSHRGSFGVIDTEKWHYADSRDMIEVRNEAFRLYLHKECTKPTRFSLSHYNNKRIMSHQQSNSAILTQNIF